MRFQGTKPFFIMQIDHEHHLAEKSRSRGTI